MQKVQPSYKTTVYSLQEQDPSAALPFHNKNFQYENNLSTKAIPLLPTTDGHSDQVKKGEMTNKLNIIATTMFEILASIVYTKCISAHKSGH